MTVVSAAAVVTGSLGAGEGTDTVTGGVAFHTGSAEVCFREAAHQALVADTSVALSICVRVGAVGCNACIAVACRVAACTRTQTD